MTMERRYRPVVLCVLDGWGHRSEPEDNAISQADTPVWDRLTATCANSLLEASNADVGLPPEQMGNSEVGHMNLGAGRIVVQDLPRIDAAVADGSLASNPVLQDLIARLVASGGSCHLLGLMSPGGVHSHQDHIAALTRALCAGGVPVAIHAFLDGRDTPPSSAAEYIKRFSAAMAGTSGWHFASLCGRYYAMDRDSRWDRVAKAYDALVVARGEPAPDADTAIATAYARGESDEFLPPTVIDGYGGIRDGDGILFANFRADRMRQIATALMDPAFDGFPRDTTPKFAAACAMTEYSSALSEFLSTLIPAKRVDGTLGEIVAAAGMKQLRIAETEKYAHVTFFFNGGEEAPYPGEERILVPSPRVATYDLKPEMSAPEVTDRLVGAIAGGTFDFIVVNYANADMVGHTGNLEAAIHAVETVDVCLGRLVEAVTAAGGALVITADHGNAEQMRDATTDQPHTAHTSGPVPFVVVGVPASEVEARNGRLADVAPTLLDLLGLEHPGEMTGTTLLVPSRSGAAAERRMGLG